MVWTFIIKREEQFSCLIPNRIFAKLSSRRLVQQNWVSLNSDYFYPPSTIYRVDRKKNPQRQDNAGTVCDSNFRPIRGLEIILHKNTGTAHPHTHTLIRIFYICSSCPSSSTSSAWKINRKGKMKIMMKKLLFFCRFQWFIISSSLFLCFVCNLLLCRHFLQYYLY